MFNLVRIENARMNVPEPLFYDVTADEAVSAGEALVLSSGKLTKCGATAKPAFIAIGCCTASQSARKIAVCRVEADQIWEVPCNAAPTALVPGSLVTLHTDGAQVTATTTSGVVTVVDTQGASAAGDRLLVRIV